MWSSLHSLHLIKFVYPKFCFGAMDNLNFCANFNNSEISYLYHDSTLVACAVLLGAV